MCISGASPWLTPDNAGQKRQGCLFHKAGLPVVGHMAKDRNRCLWKGVAANGKTHL